MELDKIGKSPKPNRPSSHVTESNRQPRRKIVLDSCPEGYDPDIWSLAITFRDRAASYQVTLAEGPILLYAHLERRIIQYNLREIIKPFNWVKFTEGMIMFFWEDHVTLATETHAIEEFCGEVIFSDMITYTQKQLTRLWKKEGIIP